MFAIPPSLPPSTPLVVCGRGLSTAQASRAARSSLTITTQPRIWSYRHLLQLVHQGSRIIEFECGARSADVVASWSLDDAATPRLNLILTDTNSPHAPLVLTDINDLGSLEAMIQDWCRNDQAWASLDSCQQAADSQSPALS